MKSISEMITAIETHKNLLPCERCPYDAPKRGRCLDKLLEDVLSLLRSITQQYADDLK